ncbi:MAG TPA: TolC family protein [Polyangiaceae bacterium]
MRALPAAVVGCIAAAVLLATRADAQTAAASTMTLDQVVATALAKHPRIRSGQADERTSDARVDEARTSQLPELGISAQINRSTGNTPPGAWFNTTGFPPVAGAPRGKSLDEGVWQTGASAWGSWDVLAFQRQAAAIDVALAGRNEAGAATQADRLEIAYEAADAFIELVEAEETVRAAKVSVDRAQVLVTMTQPLVDQNLRPGADAARAQAELAAARTALARVQQAVEVRRARLAEVMGDASLRVDAEPGSLTGPVSDRTPRPQSPSPTHPELVRSDAAVSRAKQQESAVDVQYLPRLDLVAALWVRGSGYLQSPADGLVPDIPNWAAGAVLTWSILDIPTIRARARAASASTEAASAHRDETYLAVRAQLTSATAALDGARAVANQTPATLAAARAAEAQIVARYRAGLAPVIDVADAERVLTQAEIDDAVARLEVRRAMLAVARAAGDLGPFFSAVRAGS